VNAERRSYRSLHDLVEHYFDQGWTDGLPIVPPTPEPVEAFLRHVGLGGDEVLGGVVNRSVVVTAESAAINAVMAGCRPEYFPVVVAAVRAMLRDEAMCHSVTSTLQGPAQVVLVHGPVRAAIGVNSGLGCFGPGWRANATIGRALRLVLRNVCHAVPGELDRAGFSTPGRYSFCFGENEEASPWEGLHVDRGMAPTDSAVTVFSTLNPLVPRPTRQTEDGLVAALFEVLSLDGTLWEPRLGTIADLVVVVGQAPAEVLRDAGVSRRTFREVLWKALAAHPSRPGRPLRLQGPEHILAVVAGGATAGLCAFPPQTAAAVTERVVLPGAP
jgi:hypothetical protein